MLSLKSKFKFITSILKDGTFKKSLFFHQVFIIKSEKQIKKMFQLVEVVNDLRKLQYV